MLRKITELWPNLYRVIGADPEDDEEALLGDQEAVDDAKIGQELNEEQLL